MEWYKLVSNPYGLPPGSVESSSGMFIPLTAPANSDYQTFKRDLTEGVELQDAEGNVMTAKAVKDFLKTLP